MLPAAMSLLAAMCQIMSGAPPQALTEVAVLRYLRFADRLNLCLTNLAAHGQPEIPRLVGHTLRLLNLLRDAWATVPPPAPTPAASRPAAGLVELELVVSDWTDSRLE